jgi:hypothetical protein
MDDIVCWMIEMSGQLDQAHTAARAKRKNKNEEQQQRSIFHKIVPAIN